MLVGRHEDTIVEVSVLQASRKARAFYEKLGFREIAEDRCTLDAKTALPAYILQAPAAAILKLCAPT